MVYLLVLGKGGREPPDADGDGQAGCGNGLEEGTALHGFIPP